MKEIKFIQADEINIAEIIELEKKCFTTPWTKNMFLSELHNENTLLYILMEKKSVVGYISLFKVLDEMHINNIAVDPDLQKRGYASIIMNKSIRIAKKLSITYITLEVRVSNIPAINLYKKYGFETVGARKNYYKIPNEDALIMTKNLYEVVC